MQDIEQLERAIGYFNLRLLLNLGDISDDHLQHQTVAKMSGEEIHVELIVEKFALRVRSLDRSELTAAGCVPCRSAGALKENIGRSSGDLNSSLDHDLVDNLWVSLHLEVASFSDGHEARE